MKKQDWDKIIDKHILAIITKCVTQGNFDTQTILECLSLISTRANDIKQRFLENNSADLSDEDKKAINQIKCRAPLWFAKPNKKVSIILLTFLQLSNANQKEIPLDILIDECYKNPNFDSKQNVKNNYAKMKSAKGNPNGRIFDEQNGKVVLWDKAKHIILREYETYLQKGMRQ
ncbi:hypothetical protein [Helicobacter sp. T3_23-1056]